MTVPAKTANKRHKPIAGIEVAALQKELQETRAENDVLRSENRELKRVVRKQAKQLEEQAIAIAALTETAEKLTERLDQVIRAQRTTEEFLRGEIRREQLKNTKLTEQLESAKKQLTLFRKEKFGQKSEKDLPEAKIAESPAEAQPEPEAEEESGEKKPRKKRKKEQERTDLSGLQSDSESIEMENCSCDSCGKLYRKLDQFDNSPLIDYVETLFLTNYQRAKYVPTCKCEGGKIVTAPPPPKLYNRTKLGNSAWLHLIVQKFLFNIPTNRTLQQFRLMGLDLAAATVTGGFARINELVDPLYRAIARHCKGGEFWNADETTWRVFDAEKKKKWWLWLIGTDDAVVYILDSSRSSKVPTNFFEGSAGTLMTDRYSAYKGLHAEIRKAWCWVHVRRDFLRIYEGVPKHKAWAKKWLTRISELFVLADAKYALFESSNSFGSEWEKAQEKLSKHLQSMREACELEVSKIGQDKELKKVLSSLKRHWAGLTLFVKDPRIPLHNNRAERLLRNSVLLRKNSYGSGATWAGEFAARMFSILQTWTINGLNPEAMLKDFLDESSKPGRSPPDLSQFLPWEMTSERRQHFALPKSYSRPG